jgi:hypothetical protein
MHLRHSVGLKAKNDSADVRLVQQLLNRSGAVDPRGRPLALDGVAGGGTCCCIKGFQQDFLETPHADGKVEPGKGTFTKLVQAAAEFSLFVATIYGEAGNSSEAAWTAIAHVIVNRVGTREWTAFQTVTAVIQNTGFDAYTQQTTPFKHALAAMKHRAAHHVNSVVERIIKAVRPVYLEQGVDTTSNAVLYYSPKAQAILHKAHPKLYPNETPPWKFELLKEITVPGLRSTDDFKFFAYK